MQRMLRGALRSRGVREARRDRILLHSLLLCKSHLLAAYAPITASQISRSGSEIKMDTGFAVIVQKNGGETALLDQPASGNDLHESRLQAFVHVPIAALQARHSGVEIMI